MYKTIKEKNEAIDILQKYSGNNPYLLELKRDIVLNKKTFLLNEYTVEYILKNHNLSPKPINKIVKIVDWYGEKLKQDYDIEFTPEKIQILSYLGDTSFAFYCMIKYRQNMEPIRLFLPKKAIINNFLVEDYHNIQVDFDRYDRLSIAKDPNRKLKSHQKEGIQFLLSRKKCILADDMGLGKLEPISALIPTPNGFKKMGDIKKGDLVFGQNGIACTVIDIFPHKNKEIYKVTFTDGSSMECGLEHLFLVRDKNMRTRKQGWKTKSLNELLQSGLQYNSKSRKNKNLNPINKWEIPVTEPIEYKEKEYLVHPYILGVCIGDGNMCGSCINISIPDFEKETADRISSLLPDDLYLREDRSTSCPRWGIRNKIKNTPNRYFREIKRLGLNVHGNLKFIPEEYKLGSISQRIELLRGLMDSDGSIRKGNKIGYYTNSEQLAKDVKELVCSLGGVARIHGYEREKNNKKRIEYHVLIQLKINPFYLTRKKEQYNPSFKKYCTRHILSAEYIRNEDAQCIMVDNDSHTYLTTRDYIVTHNTTTLTVAAIEGNFDSVLIICPASLKTNWKQELMWYVPERNITIIEGVNDKTKPELEKYLGYSVGKSKMTTEELKKEAKERGKWEDNQFVIVNYDILDEFYQFPITRSKENIEKAKANSPMLQYILNRKSLIIIDEAHKLSNNDSIRYKVITGLVNNGKPDSIYLATGTPITNNPLNLYCILKIINDPITMDWQYYVDRYCAAMKIPAKGEKEKWTNAFLNIVKKPNWYSLTEEEKARLKEYIRKNARMINITSGASNLEELQQKISDVYLRRLKTDINNELPNKTVHEVFYDFNMQQEMEYAKLWDEYEIAQLEADPNKEINKDLLEGAVYRKYCSDQMVPNTIKLVDEFISKGEKVIIATCYDNELYTLQEYYGEKCVIYNGKMTAKQKDNAKDEFLNNPQKMVFISNIISAGVGLTLTVSHILIFNNISWVSGDNRQMEDRCYRIGQHNDVDIYYQMFRGTQYEKMWNTVLKKELVINQVIKKENEK